MALARWEPLSELRRMHEEMDRMFESLWRPGALSIEGVSPAVDVFERDNNIVVRVDAPGLKKEDLEVTATDDSISLQGEFKTEEQARERGFYRRERLAGRFFRTIPMPAAIKPDEVKATFKEGILDVTAPIAEEAKAKEKKVPIES